MFGPWYETDHDCCQHMRNDGDIWYEMIQLIWLDTTEEDIANGLHEYCIVNMMICLDEFSNEEKEMYLSAYGYTLESVTKEYGDAANRIIAECILEENIWSDFYVIDHADSIDEAKEKIMKILGERD